MAWTLISMKELFVMMPKQDWLLHKTMNLVPVNMLVISDMKKINYTVRPKIDSVVQDQKIEEKLYLERVPAR